MINVHPMVKILFKNVLKTFEDVIFKIFDNMQPQL